MLNFDADVKKTTACHQCENPLNRAIVDVTQCVFARLQSENVREKQQDHTSTHRTSHCDKLGTFLSVTKESITIALHMIHDFAKRQLRKIFVCEEHAPEYTEPKVTHQTFLSRRKVRVNLETTFRRTFRDGRVPTYPAGRIPRRTHTQDSYLLLSIKAAASALRGVVPYHYGN